MDGATNKQTGLAQTGKQTGAFVASSSFHPKRWLKREAAKAGELSLERDREWVQANNCSEDPCGLDVDRAFHRWVIEIGLSCGKASGIAREAFEDAYVNG